jgi:hypothetical protein
MTEEKKLIGGVQWLLSVAAAISFIVGYIIAIIAGIWTPANDSVLILLFIMGILVGCFNITGREIMPYLVASIALIVIGTTGVFAPLEHASQGLYENLRDIVQLLAVFTAPAALIQALRAGIQLAAPGD